jgi:hypothetical protein
MKRIKFFPVCFKQKNVIPVRPIKTGVNTCFVLRKGDNFKKKGVRKDEDKKDIKNG